MKLIRQFPPIGYGPAMTLALRSASNPIIVTLDCDNTYQIINSIEQAIEKHYGFEVPVIIRTHDECSF